MAKLSEFKVGDKVRAPEWCPSEWTRIDYIGQSYAILTSHKNIEVVWHMADNDNNLQLYQEPKVMKKVWLWATKKGTVSATLCAEPMGGYGGEEFNIKLLWSETEVPG